MGELAEAGCVAFSQADVPLTDTQVLLRALQYAATFGHRVWLRPQDAHLARGGVAHDGEVATRLGLPAIPVIAETIALATILALVRATGVRVHLCRLSIARRRGDGSRREGRGPAGHRATSASTTCTCATSTSAGSIRTRNFVPPLRATRDRDALRAGRRRRHDRRDLLRPHAGRRRREAGAVRRGRAGRHGPRAPAAAHAQVGARGPRAARAGAGTGHEPARGDPRCRRGDDRGRRTGRYRASSIRADRGGSSAARSRARARTRRSSASKSRDGCAPRWSVARSCTRSPSSGAGRPGTDPVGRCLSSSSPFPTAVQRREAQPARRESP